MALGPKNGVVYKLLDKGFHNYGQLCISISSLMTTRDCKQAIIANKEKERVVLSEELESIQ